MVNILTPSTGEQRAGGDLRLNLLRVRAGERVLVRSSGIAGWMIAEVEAVSELVLHLRRASGAPYDVTWRELAGVVATGVDEEALIANLVALEARGDAAIDQAKRARHDSLRVMVDLACPIRSNSFVPGT